MLLLAECLGISGPFQPRDDEAGVDEADMKGMADLKHFANEPISSVSPAAILVKRAAHIYDQLMQDVELSAEVQSVTRIWATF